MNGTKLVFTDDYETWWGPGWEFDGGLTYTKVKAPEFQKRIFIVIFYLLMYAAIVIL